MSHHHRLPVRPNILFIMTDQQRFDALSVHGGIPRTPHLDGLAAQGIDLRRHFSQCPVCVPSRSVMFTGQYPEATEVGENDSRVSSDRLTLFHQMADAGYRLGYVGKDHLFAPNRRPSLDFWHDGRPDPTHPRFTEAMALMRTSFKRLRTHGSHAAGIVHDLPDEVTTTGVVGRKAVEFLESTPAGEPFFLVVSFFDPHVPHLAPRRMASLYRTSAIAPPAVGPDPVKGKHPRFQIKRAAQGSDRARLADKQQYLAIYAAMVSFVDEQVGCILDALEARSDAANTAVVFTSDHGDFGFEHGMSKKDLVLLDALLHVPLLIRLPGGQSRGRVVNALTEHVDLAPTLLDLAGLTIEPWRQGQSLLPLLDGETTDHKQAVFAAACPPGFRNPYSDFSSFRSAWEAAQQGSDEHPLKGTEPFNVPGDHCRSIRTGTWKLIGYEDGFEELYDLAQDPRESCNLATNPEFTPVLTDLRQRLKRHGELATRARKPAKAASQNTRHVP